MLRTFDQRLNRLAAIVVTTIASRERHIRFAQRMLGLTERAGIDARFAAIDRRHPL
jgi:hypothetical protein